MNLEREGEDESYWNWIPHEIKLHIVSFLGLGDSLLRCSQVNNEMYKLVSVLKKKEKDAWKLWVNSSYFDYYFFSALLDSNVETIEFVLCRWKERIHISIYNLWFVLTTLSFVGDKCKLQFDEPSDKRTLLKNAFIRECIRCIPNEDAWRDFLFIRCHSVPKNSLKRHIQSELLSETIKHMPFAN